MKSLRTIRITQKLSQKEISKILNVSQAAISKLERNNSDLHIKSGIKLAKALNIPFVELFEIESTNNQSVDFEKQITTLQSEILFLQKENRILLDILDTYNKLLQNNNPQLVTRNPKN